MKIGVTEYEVLEYRLHGSVGFLTRNDDADRNVRAPLLDRKQLDDGFYLVYRFELLDFADQGFGLFFRNR